MTGEVVATLCLKAALMHPWLLAVVVVGYAGAFAALAATLRRGLGIGTAYGLWGASGVVLTALGSWAFYGEAVTATMAVGLVLIAAGVLLVELGAQRAHAARAVPVGPVGLSAGDGPDDDGVAP